MTYTPVIPSITTNTRQDINDFMAAIITAFQGAYPSIIRKQWSELPQSLTGEGPFVYLGDINEDVQFAGGAAGVAPGLRQTTYSGSIGFVDVMADPQETNTRANVYADRMLEMLTFNARILSTGLFQPTRIVDGGEIPQSSVRLAHMVVEWTYVILQGRD